MVFVSTTSPPVEISFKLPPAAVMSLLARCVIPAVADNWIVPSAPTLPPTLVPPVAVMSSIWIEPLALIIVTTPAAPPSLLPPVVLPPLAVISPCSVIAPAPVESNSTSPPAVPWVADD